MDRPPLNRNSRESFHSARSAPSEYLNGGLVHRRCSLHGNLQPCDICDEELQQDDIRPIAPREIRYKVIAPRNLTAMDVAALIINKMIGSGIFFGPFAVFVATQNKAAAIGFWILGFVYTMFSMWLYLEYARDLPYTGGELVYLDYTFSRYRLLAFTLYAFYFAFMYNTSTNALQFGKQTLLAANPNADPAELDQRLVRLLAVCSVSLTDLLLYFSSAKSRLANSLTALAKVLCLLVVFVAAVIYACKHGHNGGDWLASGPQDSDYTSAILIIFFSYFGWDNGTLVAGEIPSYKVLRRGFYIGNVVVGLLYISISVVLGFTFSSESGPSIALINNYFATIFGDSNTAKVVTAIFVAFSASSNNLSVSYTAIRVRQILGWANVLPFSNIWRRAAPTPTKLPPVIDDVFVLRRGTPAGGVLMHWLVGVFWICVSATYDNLEEAISFPAFVMVYGHFFVEVAVGFGFCLLYDRTQNTNRRYERPQHDWEAPDPPSWLQPRKLAWYCLGVMPTLFSLLVVIWSPFQEVGRVAIYIVVGVVATGFGYWLLFVRLSTANSIGEWFGFQIREEQHGSSNEADPLRQCTLCARYDQFTVHRHRQDGYEEWNSFNFDKNHPLGRALAKLFGQRDLATDHEHIPLEELQGAER